MRYWYTAAMVVRMSHCWTAVALTTTLAAVASLGAGCNRDWDHYDPRIAVSSVGGQGSDGGYGGMVGDGGEGGMGTGGMGAMGGMGGNAVLCGGVSTFADDFQSDTIDGRWQPELVAGATIVQKDGSIVLTTGSTQGSATLLTTHKYHMEDRSMTLRVLQLPSNVNMGTSLQVYFYFSSSDTERAGMEWDGKNLVAGTLSNGRNTVAGEAGSYQPQVAQYWRIGHSAKNDKIYWETSLEGNVWQKVASVARPPSLDLSFVRVGVHLVSSGQVISAKFDDYNSKPKPEPRCTTDTLTDDFNSGIFARQWRHWSDEGACAALNDNGTLLFDVVGIGACRHESGPQLDFTGKTVSVTLLASHGGTTNTEQAEFGLLLRSSVRISFVHVLNQWHAFRAFGGPGSYDGAFEYDPQEAYKLRLREESGTIYWEYALLTDTNWTTLRTADTPAGATAAAPYMNASSDASMGETIPFQARFDDFNLEGSGSSPGR